MEIPKEVRDASVGGRLLRCLHDIALAPEQLWQVYDNGAPEDQPLPLALRLGTRVWVTRGSQDKLEEIQLTDIRAHCRPGCGAQQP